MIFSGNVWQQEIIDTAVKYNDLGAAPGYKKGELTELVVDHAFEVVTGKKSLYTKRGNDHGIDHMYPPDADGFVVVVESKQFNYGSFKLGAKTATNPEQMSDAWLRKQVGELRNSARIHPDRAVELNNSADILEICTGYE